MGTISNFIKSVKNSDQALELFKDGGEVAIDNVLEKDFGVDGVMKDIPILNIAVSLYKMGNKVSAYFFAKNMLAFLVEVDKVPREKRVEFLEENCVNEAGIENVGEVALMILDKLDHPKQATMLGRAFALLTLGVIDRMGFDAYAHIIKNLNPYLQYQFVICYRDDNSLTLDKPEAQILANYGLLEVGYKLNLSGNTSDMDISIRNTEFGKRFYQQIVIGNHSY